MNNKKAVLYGFKKSFAGYLKAEFENLDFEIDPVSDEGELLIINENTVLSQSEIKTKILIHPETNEGNTEIYCDIAISAGMSEKCTVNFSSIEYDSAMLSVNREIECNGKKLLPGEFQVDYIEEMTIYENLIINILEIIF